MTEHPVVFAGDEPQSDVSVHSSCPANQDMQYETDRESVSDDGNHWKCGVCELQLSGTYFKFPVCMAFQ